MINQNQICRSQKSTTVQPSYNFRSKAKTAVFLSSVNVEHAKELLVEEALELGIDDSVEEASTSKASKVG